MRSTPLLIAAALTACTYLESPSQCERTDDCVARGGAFALSVCRQHACVALTSPDCPTVIGGPIRDDTVLLGHLTSLQSANKSFGDASQASLRLAHGEIVAFNRGVATDASVARHPLATVVCADDTPDGQGAVRSARRLVEELGVQVLIGPVLSDTANRVAGEVTIPAGALMINPFSVSPTLSALAPSGLFFRTATANAQEGLGLALHAAQIEKALTLAEPMKVAILVRADQYGQGLAQGFLENLSLNGVPFKDGNNPNVLQRDFPRADLDPNFASEQVYREAILKHQPHLVIVLGTAEMAARITWLEANWPSGRPRPYYLGSEGQKSANTRTLLQSSAAQATGLQQRMRMFAPRVNGAYYQGFANRWQGQNGGQAPPDIYGTTTSYDALYLTVYALATLGGQPLTGARVAAGLWRTVPPLQGSAKPIPAGPNALVEAVATLAAGGTIDYDGVSGPLDFDLARRLGEAPNDYDILCLSGNPLLFNAVQTYRVPRGASPAYVSVYAPCP